MAISVATPPTETTTIDRPANVAASPATRLPPENGWVMFLVFLGLVTALLINSARITDLGERLEQVESKLAERQAAEE